MESVEARNRRVMSEARPGDMIECPRGPLYSHWAVYVGNEEVIHLTGGEEVELAKKVPLTSSSGLSGKTFNKAIVKRDRFLAVAGKHEVKINNSKDERCKPNKPEDILRAAEGMLGEKGYNLLWHNCEHFASLCRYGTAWSEQAEKVEGFALATAVSALVIMVSHVAAVVIDKYTKIN